MFACNAGLTAFRLGSVPKLVFEFYLELLMLWGDLVSRHGGYDNGSFIDN